MVTSGPTQEVALSVKIDSGPAYVSFSSFMQWLRCGKAWQLSRLLEVKEEPAHYFVGGSAVHAATEAYDRALWAEGRR